MGRLPSDRCREWDFPGRRVRRVPSHRAAGAHQVGQVVDAADQLIGAAGTAPGPVNDQFAGRERGA